MGFWVWVSGLTPRGQTRVLTWVWGLTRGVKTPAIDVVLPSLPKPNRQA